MLLAGGLVVGPVFTVTYLADGAARARYKPLRHPVSCLRPRRTRTDPDRRLRRRGPALPALQRVSVTIAWASLAVLAVPTLRA
ncbi:hypothetical protein [Microbispora hainanensis]|uniref:Uncharacterized protein n=1 Tax=Microbispora hainanensis TaxID=568844 RepID=A0A544YQ02_9ACTN|nr:hypothetical protein [Microbispora hainanensis]TQS18849.1 hypothetical protein FLX08_23120 [Microbispora hainanensis]